MKKTALRFLFLTLALGFVVSTATVANAGGVFCLKYVYPPESCEEFRLVWDETADPLFFSIVGYEYGCGYPEATLHGSARYDLADKILHIQYTYPVSISVDPWYRIIQDNILLDLSTGIGDVQRSTHKDIWTKFDFGAQMVPCP